MQQFDDLPHDFSASFRMTGTCLDQCAGASFNTCTANCQEQKHTSGSSEKNRPPMAGTAMLRFRSSKGLNRLLTTQKSGQLEVSLYPSPQETEHGLHLDHCEYWHTWTHNQSWLIPETVPACCSTRSSTVFGESGHDTCQ